VDGFYVDHGFYNWPYDASFYEKLRKLPFAEVLAPRDKSYSVSGGGPERERLLLEDGAPPPQLSLSLAEIHAPMHLPAPRHRKRFRHHLGASCTWPQA
jgi:hypothetical protein